jgi:hypothetical protein
MPDKKTHSRIDLKTHRAEKNVFFWLRSNEFFFFRKPFLVSIYDQFWTIGSSSNIILRQLLFCFEFVCVIKLILKTQNNTAA